MNHSIPSQRKGKKRKKKSFSFKSGVKDSSLKWIPEMLAKLFMDFYWKRTLDFPSMHKSFAISYQTFPFFFLFFSSFSSFFPFFSKKSVKLHDVILLFLKFGKRITNTIHFGIFFFLSFFSFFPFPPHFFFEGSPSFFFKTFFLLLLFFFVLFCCLLFVFKLKGTCVWKWVRT